MQALPILVALDKIVPNPWRDLRLSPLSDSHVTDLVASIGEHGFFASLKGRRVGDKVELGCGHARAEAARRAGLSAIPVYIDDLDDDEMLRLMTDENALQSGASPGAVMNEVAAVTRRIIEGLLESGGTIVPAVAGLFESKGGIASACSKVRNGNAHIAIGHNVIRAYLGHGDATKARRGERQIREAIAALKQSGRYDDIVDEAVRQSTPASKKPPAKGRAVAKPKPRTPRRPRIFDDRTATLFPNDHQFHAFREAITGSDAQQFIPVDKQYDLAKEIMEGRAKHGFSGKQVGAPYITAKVREKVNEARAGQRTIDSEEERRWRMESLQNQLDAELHTAAASTRSLLSALVKLNLLITNNPMLPFSAQNKLVLYATRLKELTNLINKFDDLVHVRQDTTMDAGP